MGSITEYISYINVKKHPTKLDIEHFYTHIEITPNLKKIRKSYRRELKRELKNVNNLFDLFDEQHE